ncbi:FMRFamide receptor-like [Babylonia areolata]|uniref:FMRFamide receptor-like n=1 Tax=Babylonia areolata TaxID=304850 RepID=UPI003FD1CE8B
MTALQVTSIIFKETSTWQSTKENSTLSASDTSSFLGDIDTILWYIIPPILLILGTFGNVMTVVVMRGMRSSQSTACLSVYFTALALSDQCLLMTSLTFFWVHMGFSWPPSFFRYDLLCIAPKFLWCTSGVTSAWFLVSMTYQRVISVIAPHRVKILCTVRRGKIIVAVIVILAVALNLHFMFSWSYWPEHGDCQYRESYMIYLEIFEWLDLIWASMIPFLFLAAGNSVLVWQVVKAKQFSQKLRGNVEQQATSGTDKVHSMSMTLILTSVAFLVLTLPVCIFDVLLEMISGDDFSALIKLMETFVIFLWISASAYNFYLYLLSGSKFRQETKRCLRFQDAGKAK